MFFAGNASDAGFLWNPYHPGKSWPRRGVRTSIFRAILALAILLLPIVPLIPALAQGEVPCADARGCPDLWVDRARMSPYEQTRTFSSTNCAVVEGMVQAGTRDLLRFTFTSPNSGAGDLIVGAPSQHPEWFVWSPCHNHYHFREYADYRLWTNKGYVAWTQLKAAHPEMTSAELLAANPAIAASNLAGHKQGFCVIDIIRYQSGAPSKYHSCGSNQGIAVGWADEYGSGLDGQWIDITGIAPGSYTLEAEVNAERLYKESDYTDNSAFQVVQIGRVGALPIELPVD